MFWAPIWPTFPCKSPLPFLRSAESRGWLRLAMDSGENCQPFLLVHFCDVIMSGLSAIIIYNLLKIDETNHKRDRNRSHITRARRMCQTARRPSRRESEEPQRRRCYLFTLEIGGEGQFITSWKAPEYTISPRCYRCSCWVVLRTYPSL